MKFDPDTLHIRDLSKIPTRIEVTDHALLRYMERVQGIDLTAIREEIATDLLPLWMPGVKVVKRAGLRYVFQDNRLLTVAPRKSKKQEAL
jgi:hypothetical protein